MSQPVLSPTCNGRHLLFDFDGTIADSLGLVVDLYNALSRKHGFSPMEKQEIATLRQLTLRERFKKLGIPLYRLPGLGRELLRDYAGHVSSLPCYPGIPEALLSLRQAGYRLSIISSNSVENIQRFLEHHGLSHFEQVQSVSGLFGKDRNIRGYLKREGISPRDALYIGDELRDLEASKKAGIRMIAVTWGADTEELLTSKNPDALAHQPADLPETARRLFEG